MRKTVFCFIMVVLALSSCGRANLDLEKWSGNTENTVPWLFADGEGLQFPSEGYYCCKDLGNGKTDVFISSEMRDDTQDILRVCTRFSTDNFDLNAGHVTFPSQITDSQVFFLQIFDGEDADIRENHIPASVIFSGTVDADKGASFMNGNLIMYVDMGDKGLMKLNYIKLNREDYPPFGVRNSILYYN